MSLTRKIGDLYHKHAYGKIAGLSAVITDRTNLALTDLLLGIAFVGDVTQFLAIPLLGYCLYYTFSSSQNVSEVAGKAATFIGAAVATAAVPIGIVAVNYGVNALRTPLTEHLKLGEAELDEKVELEYTIRKLNELAESPRSSFEETNEAINVALDKTLKKYYGYSVKHAKKTKRSIFSKLLIRRNCGGLMNPFFQEIVVTSPHFLEVIAHEKAHLAGFSREIDAQLMGYMALHSSNDHSMNYLAYLLRLDLLVNYLGGFRSDEDSRLTSEQTAEKLTELGLNSRTVNEIRSREKFLEEVRSKTPFYTRIINKVDEFTRNFLLRKSGQGGIEEALATGLEEGEILAENDSAEIGLN